MYIETLEAWPMHKIVHIVCSCMYTFNCKVRMMSVANIH